MMFLINGMSIGPREILQLTSGALQTVAPLLPAGERHVLNYTGQWQRFGSLTIAEILNMADAALDPAKEI